MTDATPNHYPVPTIMNHHDAPALGRSEMDGVLVFDKERLFPASVAADVGLDHASMSVLEVPNGSSSLYNALLQYAAHYAVDLDESLPERTANDYSPEDDGDSNEPLHHKDVRGVSIPLREGEGKLSTLWNCPVDRYDPYGITDSESDSDSDSESEPDDSDSEDGDPKQKMESLLERLLSMGSVKKKVDPPVQRYQMGLGFAKVRVGDAVVYLHHWGYGLPVNRGYSIQVFRSIVLAGEDPESLQELCAVALKWRSDREFANTVPRPGRFTLFRFKTNGAGCGDWSNQGYKRARLPKSVILPEGQLESIVRDLKDFCAKDTKAWYEAHGLPHRRSYLFHGPPGCGKTSCIRMIAGLFRLNAYFLSLTAGDFSNQVLQDALTSLPRRALLVLEDVDVLFNEDRKSETTSALTFSGMLNALDGLISVDEIITILTTNRIEKLDPALIRGGRVDRRFEFCHPGHKQMCKLFLSFYEDAPRQLAERFADAVLSRPEQEARSIATLQQHFIYTRKMNAEACLKMLPQFFAEFYPKGGQARNPLYL